MTNPFDDHFDSVARLDTNPFNSAGSFDDGMGAATDPGEESYTADDDDDLNHNDSMLAADAPVEASWQYLGDLPYRRVPVYKNVRWGVTKDDGTEDDAKNQIAETLNYGLSSFPKSAIQRHPDLMNPRELRELLNSSTVTKVCKCLLNWVTALSSV